MAPRQRIIAMQPQEMKRRTKELLIRSESFESDDTACSVSSASSDPSSQGSNEDTNLEIQRARTNHDYFNLVALLFVIGTTAIDWDYSKLLQGNPTEAFLGKYFYVNWATTTLYFFIDLIWVAKIPASVKSPDTIVKHHLISMIYLLGPVAWPKYRWFMGGCLSVEINTWFLILRRVLFKSTFNSQILSKLVATCFYVSWIVIRVFLYPAIMVQFLILAHQAIVETNRWFHWPMLAFPVHFFLCVLNLKWTYDLFVPIIKDWVAPSSAGKRHTISSGL